MKRIGLLGLLVLALLGLAGCGGGTPPPPSSITLTVEDATNSFNAAAYQVGSGSWQPLTLSGTTTKTGTFNLGGQTKYGVAVRCSSLVVKVIQATASELPNPKVVCSSPVPSTVSFTVIVNVDSSLLAGGDSVCVNGMSCVPSSGSVSITTSGLEPGTQDLLLTLIDSSSLVKVAKVLRNVSVTNNGSTIATLAALDQLSPVNLTPPTAPTGYAPVTSAAVFYLSAGGATGMVNATLTSYRPVSGFGSGDRYGALVQTSGTNASLMSAQVFAGGVPTLVLPAPWGSSSLAVTQSAHPSVSGLNRSEADLRSYRFYLQIPAKIYYTATVSKGWLGNATSYALPDLSASTLLGYTAPTGSGYFEISAFFSNKALLSQDAADPSSFQAGDDIREAKAYTNSYTVGGGPVSLP